MSESDKQVQYSEEEDMSNMAMPMPDVAQTQPRTGTEYAILIGLLPIWFTVVILISAKSYVGGLADAGLVFALVMTLLAAYYFFNHSSTHHPKLMHALRIFLMVIAVISLVGQVCVP